MSKLKIVSYNIWFDIYLEHDRINSLVFHLHQDDPDIICLQEVKPNVYNILKNKLKRYKYKYPEHLCNSYGCVIFSKHYIKDSFTIEFPNSRMGRSLLIANIKYPYYTNTNHKNTNHKNNNHTDYIDLIITTTHFESLFKKNICNKSKIKQYKMTHKVLNKLYKTYKNVIFCADTNVLKHEEDKFIPTNCNELIDCWKIKGNTDNEYTYDSKNNIYLAPKYAGRIRSRIDRILYRADNFSLKDFDFVKISGECIEPSDHYGIFGNFFISN